MLRNIVCRIVVTMATAAVCLTAPRGAARGQSPELVVQSGHAGSIFSVAFSPDGRLLASGSMDGTIKLWDIGGGGQIASLPGGAISLSFNPDGTLLAAAGTDGKTRLWDVASGTVRRTLGEGVVSVAFGREGRMLAGASGTTVKLWDAASGALLTSFTGHTAKVVSVAFSPDGRALASGSYDKTVKLWDVTSGSQLRSLAHPGDVIATKFSPDGGLLASLTSKGVKLWDTAGWAELRSLEGTPSWINSIAFSPDGKLLAGANQMSKSAGGIRLWDVASGTHTDLIEDSPDMMAAVAFSPDGKLLASGSMGVEIKLWDVAKRSPLRVLKRFTSSAATVAFSPGGRLLAIGSLGEEVKLWDMTSGGQFSSFESTPGDSSKLELFKRAEGMLRMLLGAVGFGSFGLLSPLAFSPDGKLLASGYLGDKTEPPLIALWDVASRKRLKTFTGHNGLITALAFSPDGKLLVSGDADNKLVMWDVARGTRLSSLDRHTNIVTAVAFSPDGRLLASGGLDDTINLWDVASGAHLRSIKNPTGWITSVAFSPDAKLLASGNGGMLELFGPNDNSIKLWDVATGASRKSLEGHSGTVNSVAFSPDGRLLVSGSNDKTVRLWDVAGGSMLRVLEGHSDQVTAVAFSQNGRRLVSSSGDATVKVWSADASAPLASLISLGKNDWLVVTPDNLFDGSTAAWRRSIWRFSSNTFDYAPVEAFFSEFYRPGLLAEIMSDTIPKAERSIARKDIRQPQVRVVRVGGPATGNSEVTTPAVSVQVEVIEAPADAQRNLPAGGVRDVRLFRNGALVRIWRGDALAAGRKDDCRRQGPGRVACVAEVPVVAGENRLTAYAFNRDNVKSNDGELTVEGAAALKRGGTLYVLAVGINHYANPSYDLRYAVADARDFGRELKAQQDRLGVYAETRVISLIDREATKANLLLVLRRLAEGDAVRLPPAAPTALGLVRKAKPEDAVVIYFAGHGIADKDRFYIIPYDLGGANRVSAPGRRSLNLLHTRSVSDLELEAALEGVDAGHLLMVIDTCHSGQALEAEERRRGPMNSRGLAQLAYEKGMYILTAAQSQQAALEVSRLGHGLLTYSLLEGLSGLKADADQNRELWDREWMDYATERVPQLQVQETERRGAEIMFIPSDRNAPAAEPNVQRPRVFYRREASPRPFIIARP